ncbi:MAG: Gfo/Idh/MocA family oxidoreductase [Verrucomicrobiota bacterium]|jgi:predicted dehydrogenase|nr:Gfo/Idh/MocA family oxidoreductase [Verrucomicrobiota bacterium]
MKSLFVPLLSFAFVALAAAKEIRIGLIGLDTSHVIAFTKVINDPKATGPLASAKVVAAFKGGSLDVPSSAGRVEKFTKTLSEDYGLKLYPSIAELCKNVDAVMIESVDGRPHLRQSIPVIDAGLPVFIDKPMAGSLADAIFIFDYARRKGVPLFSSSSLRYGKATQAARNGALGKITYAETFSPASLEVHHPDLFWYGVHGCESLFTVMGPGCETVERRSTAEGKIEVIGKWKGGRTGIFREGKGYGGSAKGTKGEGPVGGYDGYTPLVVEVIKMFQSGKVPVAPQETIELLAFMAAADESKRREGKPVEINEIIKQARQ